MIVVGVCKGYYPGMLSGNEIYDVIVIGGGVTGLACAYRFRGEGVRVLICDPGGTGGVIRTLHQDGFTLEQGPNVFLEKPALRSLISALEMDDQVVYPVIENYKQLVLHEGRPVEVPRNPLKLLLGPLIPFASKIGLPAGLLRRGLTGGSPDLSVMDLFSRIAGRQTVENIIDPVLLGIYGGDVLKLSARSLFPSLWESLSGGRSVAGYLINRTRTAVRPRIFMMKNGMSSLTRRMAERLGDNTVIKNLAVTGLQKEGGLFSAALSDGSSVSAGQVYIATSGGATAKFIGDLDPGLADQLNRLRYADLSVVHCSVSRESGVPADAFGVLIPSRAGLKTLGIMYNSALFPHMAPQDRHLLTVCLGGINNSGIMAASDGEMQRIVSEELAKTFPFMAGAEFLAVTRWPGVIPQYEVGHYRIPESMKLLEQRLPGIHFIGSDKGGVGVPDRVRAGFFG